MILRGCSVASVRDTGVGTSSEKKDNTFVHPHSCDGVTGYPHRPSTLSEFFWVGQPVTPKYSSRKILVAHVTLMVLGGSAAGGFSFLEFSKHSDWYIRDFYP